MKFALRNPCRDCPFRSDRDYPFFGRDAHGRARALELTEGFIGHQHFPCHKTTAFVSTADGDSVQQHNENTTACAGMVIMAEHDPRHSNTLRIAERLGLYDRNQMNMDAPVYRGYDEFIDDHTERNQS